MLHDHELNPEFICSLLKGLIYFFFEQLGLFAGCFVALFVGYVIMAHITGMYRSSKSDAVYMETVYPVLRQVQKSLIFADLVIIHVQNHDS